MATLDYIELPVKSTGQQSAFYSKAFSWKFTSYGEDYAAHEEGPCQLGLNGTGEQQGKTILPVIRVAEIDTAFAAVKAAGGTITQDIFAFPGGKRFHFADPEGLELACYEPESA